MNRSIANQEHHYFKHSRFCGAGGLHVRFLGTAMLSFAGQASTKEGNVF